MDNDIISNQQRTLQANAALTGGLGEIIKAGTRLWKSIGNSCSRGWGRPTSKKDDIIRKQKRKGVGSDTGTNYTMPNCSHLDSAVYPWPWLFERTCAARKTIVLAADMPSRSLAGMKRLHRARSSPRTHVGLGHLDLPETGRTL